MVRTRKYVPRFIGICLRMSNLQSRRLFTFTRWGPDLNKLEQKTEITRTALFLAARDVIVKEGYDRAQLETIAKHAGRTKGSVYAHFESKEDLFLAMMEYILEERRSRVLGLSIDENGEALRIAIRTMCARA